MSKTPAELLAASRPRKRSTLKSTCGGKPTPWNCGVRGLRESLGLSLDLVAAEVGLSKTALWQIEHGTDPMLTSARRLATFFGRHVESLWTLKAGDA